MYGLVFYIEIIVKINTNINSYIISALSIHSHPITTIHIYQQTIKTSLSTGTRITTKIENHTQKATQQTVSFLK